MHATNQHIRTPAVAAPADAAAPPAKRLKTVGAPLQPGVIRAALLAPESAAALREAHDASGPYAHVVLQGLAEPRLLRAVLQGLAEPRLLRAVRDEVINNVQATYKETDLFKVFQTGAARSRVCAGARFLSERVFFCREARLVVQRHIAAGQAAMQLQRCSDYRLVLSSAACGSSPPPPRPPSNHILQVNPHPISLTPSPPTNSKGDLANLDELDPASAAKLPSLMRLRDALYSQELRT